MNKIVTNEMITNCLLIIIKLKLVQNKEIYDELFTRLDILKAFFYWLYKRFARIQMDNHLGSFANDNKSIVNYPCCVYLERRQHFASRNIYDNNYSLHSKAISKEPIAVLFSIGASRTLSGVNERSVYWWQRNVFQSTTKMSNPFESPCSIRDLMIYYP